MPSPNQTHSSSEPSAASSEGVSSTCSASAPVSTGASGSGSGSETHTCPYKDCKKSFSKKYNLKAHLRLHTGEEPFECDRPDCRKKFKWRSSLSSHSIWHTRKDNGSVSASPDPKSTDSTKKGSSLKCETSSPTRVAKPITQAKNRSGYNTTKMVHKVGKAAAPVGNRITSKVEISAATVALNVNKKKRPRSETSRKGKTIVPVIQSDAPSTDESSGTIPSLSEFCFSSDGMGFDSPSSTAPATPKTVKRKASRPSSKKRKTNTNKKSGTATVESSPPAVDADVDIFSSPGSPVTSESGLSEHSLGLDLFSCDVLPPLMEGDGEPLALGADDVGALLTGDGDVGMFGYASPSCGTLNGLDSRFGPFDLDNFQNFCLGKVERL